MRTDGASGSRQRQTEINFQGSKRLQAAGHRLVQVKQVEDGTKTRLSASPAMQLSKSRAIFGPTSGREIVPSLRLLEKASILPLTPARLLLSSQIDRARMARKVAIGGQCPLKARANFFGNFSPWFMPPRPGCAVRRCQGPASLSQLCDGAKDSNTTLVNYQTHGQTGCSSFRPIVPGSMSPPRCQPLQAQTSPTKVTIEHTSSAVSKSRR
jgi:hypothetical protein